MGSKVSQPTERPTDRARAAPFNRCTAVMDGLVCHARINSSRLDVDTGAGERTTDGNGIDRWIGAAQSTDFAVDGAASGAAETVEVVALVVCRFDCHSCCRNRGDKKQLGE